jgi:F-type H+-transporting ATPase subunit b
MTIKNNAEVSAGGMPQLDFSTFPNQAFWLIVTILCLFMMIRFLIIPRMDNILANRRKVIDEDLVGAEGLRKTAQELEISITEEVDTARFRSTDIINKTKEKN